MGDMTIRGIDDETLARLRSEARERGVSTEELACEILRLGMALASPDRTAVPHEILPASRTCRRSRRLSCCGEVDDEAS